MKTESTKVVISVDSQEKQQENIRSSRKTLRDLQYDAADKENIVGRSSIKTTSKMTIIENSDKSDLKRKKPTMASKGVQTGEITAHDLMSSEEPGLDYWKKLAEKRGESLNQSFEENEKLKEEVEHLQEENRICKEMLEEARHLVDVLNEMTETDNVEETES